MSKHTEQYIDVLDLYCNGDHKKWNAFLTKCYEAQDVATLVDVFRRLQMGMDKLVKEKLNTEKMNEFFIRLQRSIEITMKRIYREKNPNPLYNSKNKQYYDKYIKEKKSLDADFEKFLSKERY